jgi:lysophospholipase L1-like esterase
MFADALRSARCLWRSRTLLALLSGAFLLAYGWHAECAHAAEEPAAFTWHLPSGYIGDPPGNGLVPETNPDTIEANRWLLYTVISPAWCENDGTYSWSTKSEAIASIRTSRCRYTLELPDEGAYAITLTAEIRGKRTQDTRQVLVKGRLIVAIGDSIASGEGVPDTHGPIGGDWQNRQCHRSARAAPAIAAQIIQRRKPRTPITFIHLACSGATILNGLVGPYRGIAPRRGQAPLEPQVDVLDSIETRRKIDAVLISIGANDVHFSDVIKQCNPIKGLLRSRPCFLRKATLDGKRYATLEQGIADAVSKLPAHYALLHAAMAGIPPSRIYLMQYYDPTRAANGLTCPKILGIGSKILDEARKLVLEPLNRIGQEVAELYGWHYITGIRHLFDRHGYCVKGSQGWVVKGGSSLLNETSVDGTLHPNAEGHREIAKLIATALLPALYPPVHTNGSTKKTSSTVPKVMKASAETVAWVCFGLGALILLAGVAIGLILSLGKTTKGLSAKDASSKVKDATAKVQALKTTAVASANSPASDATAAATASSQADEVQSVLQEIGGIVSSLPESLRFAGLLVLIGTVLISVATIQFGGHSIF